MVRDGLWDVFNNFHMGNTGEIVAQRHGITRADADKFALWSHQKSVNAIKSNSFKDEIVHVEIPSKKEVSIFMIADLRGLPFFATESMVKWGTKREKLPVTILLDWGGKVSELYKTQRGESNLFIIGREGKVKYYYAGQCIPENVKTLNVKVQEILKEKKTL
jgi:hypothetical protein